MVTTRREYPGGAGVQRITGSVLSTSGTSCSIDGTSGWSTGSTGPFAVVVDLGQPTEEKILVLTQSAGLLTFSQRAYDGTSAQIHQVGATVQPCGTAVDNDEANLHTSSTAGVHGITGAVLGTTDTQTVGNKNFSSTNTWSGGLILPKTPWTAVTYASGFTDNAGGRATGQYKVDANGWVTVQGTFKSSGPSWSSGATVVTGLPAPADGLTHGFVSYNYATGAACGVEVWAGGQIVTLSTGAGGATGHSFDGLGYQS